MKRLSNYLCDLVPLVDLVLGSSWVVAFGSRWVVTFVWTFPAQTQAEHEYGYPYIECCCNHDDLDVMNNELGDEVSDFFQGEDDI